MKRAFHIWILVGVGAFFCVSTWADMKVQITGTIQSIEPQHLTLVVQGSLVRVPKSIFKKRSFFPGRTVTATLGSFDELTLLKKRVKQNIQDSPGKDLRENRAGNTGVGQRSTNEITNGPPGSSSMRAQ